MTVAIASPGALRQAGGAVTDSRTGHWMERIAVFTGHIDHAVRKGIAELAARYPQARFLVVQHRPRKSLRRVLRNQWRHLRRNGWRWIAYRAGLAIESALERRVRARWRSQTQPGRIYRDEALFDGERVRLETTANIHGAASLKRLRRFAPDLGLSLAAPVLKPTLFEIPRLGTLNLHKGRLPDYRGMPPAFWECLNGEDSVGCTVHRVDRGLDTGDIVLEASVPRHPYSTARGLMLTLDEVGVRLTCEAVELVASGQAQPRPQPAGGTRYTTPTLREQAELARRERGHGRHDSAARRHIKEGVATAYVHARRPLRRLAGAGEVVVLLYHRVNDEMRDALTVGVEQFEAQMAHIARHYPVASIDDVIHGRVPAGGSRPVVAVTFDDGYQDNYTHAMPALLRHGIPAAFFVSTGMIGQPRGFDHDLRGGGSALPNMDWDQLREMHAHGFTIGAHTVSHANCARLAPGELRRELVESRDRLVAELGLREVFFAYPFGRREDITPAALETVREVGYAGCLSAYGGVNRGPVDPFNVLRMGVDYNFGLRRFAARLEGW